MGKHCVRLDPLISSFFQRTIVCTLQKFAFCAIMMHLGFVSGGLGKAQKVFAHLIQFQCNRDFYDIVVL